MNPSPPPGFALRSEGATVALVGAELAGVALESLWAAGTPLSGATGRGGVAVLEPLPGLRLVARDYRRGGALRSLLPDRFLDERRAFREVSTLAALRAAGVCAVEPLAALAEGSGPLVRLRLCTRLLEGALPLPAFCAEAPRLARAAIESAGALIAAAFAAGLRHPDLHPENVLARRAGDRAETWLVDLDRARVLGKIAERDRDAMLVRFARYLVRHAERLPTRPARPDVTRFLRGMGLGRSGRRAALARLVPAFQRSLARHRLSWWR